MLRLGAMAPAVVGHYTACETPTMADHDRFSAFEHMLQIQAAPSTSPCGSFCRADGDMYLEDRCWNTRAVCRVVLRNATNGEVPTALFVGQRDAEAGRELVAGEYLTVLGPAAALGVSARVGFADRLRERLRAPVVNLGRGAAGPSDYVRAWPSLAPLLSQSRANIVVIMAGRSSANSAFPAQADGAASSGVVSMARDAGVKRLHDRGDPSWRRLVNESLATALGEYTALARSIRQHAASLGRAPPPLLLLWFSDCELRTGCASIHAFPQYYTRPDAAHAIARRAGATLVDASFGHADPAAPLPLDQCPGCAPLVSGRYGHVCFMDMARRQTNYWGVAPQDRTEAAADGRSVGRAASRRERLAGLGCTQMCASVLPTYYPHDAAHEVAASALLLALLQPTTTGATGRLGVDGVSLPPAAAEDDASGADPNLPVGFVHPLDPAPPPPARALSQQPANGALSHVAVTRPPHWMAGGLPRLDTGRKIFFHHVHKSAVRARPPTSPLAPTPPH